MGIPALPDERIREYVVLYNETLRYINNHINEDSLLKEFYGKFPAIELKEFNKPIDKIIDFIFRFLGDVLFSGRYIRHERMSPEHRKYINSIHETMPLVNTIASELIMRIGE
jgi:hypothetical protein